MAFKTKSKKMSKQQAKKAVSSIGMSYPNTAHNKRMVADSIDTYMKTLRKRKRKKRKKR